MTDECLSLAKEIANNSFTAVKTSKMLINKGMDVDINTGLQLCFAHEDRQKMMSAFLDKAKKKWQAKYDVTINITKQQKYLFSK